MTLVEIIVAIVILALVTIPLLHAFVTGANSERKSRQYGEATIVAQNLIESIESMSMSQVLSADSVDGFAATFCNKNWQPPAEKNGAPVPDKMTNRDARRYYMMLDNVSYDGSSTLYDARITLEANNTDASGINNAGLIKSNAVDAAVNISGLDEQVYADLIAKNTGRTVTMAQAREWLTRTIEVTVTRPAGERLTCHIEVLVKYHGDNAVIKLIPVTVSLPDGTTTTEWQPGPPEDYDSNVPPQKTTCDVTLPESNKDALFSLFLYMKGSYVSGDQILINNSTGQINNTSYDFNVFLVDTSSEEERPADASAYLSKTRISYKNQVTHTEIVDPEDSSSASNKLMKRVYTNLAGFKGSNQYYIGNGWRKPITGSLVETTENDHFYNISVELYRRRDASAAQADVQTPDNLVLTMNSS